MSENKMRNVMIDVGSFTRVASNKIHPEGIMKPSKTLPNKLIPKLKRLNTDRSIKTIVSNLFNETKYMNVVDRYDKFITFSTVFILIFTLIFFIWGYVVGAGEIYINNKNGNKSGVDALNFWYKIWKVIKFVVNFVAVVCVGVQLYRRGIHPILENNEVVTILNDAIVRINARRNAQIGVSNNSK
jgi:hypothetical protein